MANIVKVQVSVGGKEAALIYNEDRSIAYETYDPMQVKALRLRLDNEPKKYFYYKVGKGDQLILEDEAPWQEW